MRSILIKYIDLMNKYFEHLIAVIALLGTVYFGIHIIIYIGRFLWNAAS